MYLTWFVESREGRRFNIDFKRANCAYSMYSLHSSSRKYVPFTIKCGFDWFREQSHRIKSPKTIISLDICPYLVMFRFPILCYIIRFGAIEVQAFVPISIYKTPFATMISIFFIFSIAPVIFICLIYWGSTDRFALASIRGSCFRISYFLQYSVNCRVFDYGFFKLFWKRAAFYNI